MDFDKKDKVIAVLLGVIIILILVILGVVIFKKDDVVAKSEFNLESVECKTEGEYFCVKTTKNDAYNVTLKSKLDCETGELTENGVCTESTNEVYINDTLIHTFSESAMLPDVTTSEEVLSILKEYSKNIDVYILLDTYALITRDVSSIWRSVSLDIYNIKDKEKLYEISNNGEIYEGEDFTEDEMITYVVTDNSVTYYTPSEKVLEDKSEWSGYTDKVKLTFYTNDKKPKKEIISTSKSRLVSGAK